MNNRSTKNYIKTAFSLIKNDIMFSMILVLICIYSFSLFSFSARETFNYVHIFISIVVGVLSLLYAFLFGTFRIDIFFASIFLFCCLMIISAVLNQSLNALTKSVFLNAGFSFALYQFFSSKKSFYPFLVSFLIGGCLFYIYYVWHYRSDIFSLSFLKNGIRLGDYFDNQNGIARSFTLIGFVSYFLAFSFKKYYLILICLLSFFLLLTTGSISNLILFIVLFAAYTIFQFNKKWKFFTILGIAAFSALFFALLQLPTFEYFKERILGIFLTIFSGGSIAGDGSALGRLEYAFDGFKVFLSSPLFGVGPNGLLKFTSGGYAHNNISELAADFGLFGPILFETFLLLPAFKTKKLPKNEKNFVLSILLFLFLFQFFLVTYATKVDYFLIPFCYGLVKRNIENFAEFKFISKNRKSCHLFMTSKIVFSGFDFYRI